MAKEDSSLSNTLQRGRADWHLRANALVVIYLIAALISGALLRNPEGGEPAWLTVHLLLLGAVTNAIVAWSDHFASALLWARSQKRSRQMALVSLLNVGIVGVLISVSNKQQWLTVVFAAVICGVIIFYLRGIGNLLRQSLNKKFKGVIAYYQFAALSVLLGIVLGVLDSHRSDEDLWQPRIALAHLHANLLGWVGLTIIGTLVTLWPTVLRTQIHPKAISSARLGLNFLLVAVVGCVGGSLINSPYVLAASLVLYLAGAVIALAPAARLFGRRIPDTSSSWMMLIGTVGLVVVLVADMYFALSTKSGNKYLSAIENHLLVLSTLWILPILLGSLTHLLPVVLGRGPSTSRKLLSILNFCWLWRLPLLPLASVLLLFSATASLGRAVLVLALGVFLVLALIALITARTLRPAEGE